uniref:Uncharacterized protein n=1 Tax=Arundo donax TaxID=35708 RepID=A0A0A8Z2C5_ARUDO
MNPATMTFPRMSWSFLGLATLAVSFCSSF